jgi:predicted ATP-dependent endonuclease of OLD family
MFSLPYNVRYSEGEASKASIMTMVAYEQYRFFRELIEQLASIIEGIEFVGPLREQPARYYTSSGEKVYSVGILGEDAIQVLYQDNSGNLIREVSRWLSKLKASKKVKIKRIHPNMFALEIRNPFTGRYDNMADVGFGISQVIPVIVQSYLTSPNRTLILEQPEIHLHPSAQAVLGDLLLELAQIGKRFLVETHSEHFILRLQRRVAEGKLDAEMVKIYYFDPNETGVVIRQIDIDKQGQLLNFPRGFLEDGFREAYKIAMASPPE